MREDRKKIFIRTFGCQMNVRDSEVVAGLLRRAGYSLTDDESAADVVIFNTCSVRQHAEDKVWSAVGNIVKRAKAQKEAKARGIKKPLIGLIGCMAQNYREQVFERSPGVDFAVGPSDIEKIPGIIGQLSAKGLYERKIWETDGQVRPEDIYHTGFYADPEHAYVVISEGCSNYCSYCVVPYVRGSLHNRGHQGILKEIRSALANGVSRVTLLGQNVNAYQDGNFSFIDLLQAVNKLPGLQEFTFVTSHPRDTTPELFRVMAGCDKLKKNLHLPVQSGSDKVLKAMNRGYTRKFYLDLADNYRKIVKGGTLTTDIIVGFCGETEEDFRDTFDLVKAVEFNAAYIFKYSPRPGTKALDRPDDVTVEEKERRHALILDLQKSICAQKKVKK